MPDELVYAMAAALQEAGNGGVCTDSLGIILCLVLVVHDGV